MINGPGSDSKLSILGTSFTGIVKNARVVSYHCDITYAGPASNLPPETHVDHAYVHMLTFMCYGSAICTPPTALGSRK